ncbi:MAG TPA: FtsX-like permease family protein [Actinomycetota bacterium]|nr:FtsX-like permease family protein [Actinomycetota bacterium]
MSGPLVLVALALGGALYQMARRPMLRRLAVRDALRRRSETMLVIAGSLLGTAIITGSFIVGDTLDSSIRVTASTQYGPVDEGVTVPDRAEAQELAAELSALDDGRIDGVLSMLRAPASVSVERGDDTLAEPSAQLVEVDFDEARAFGGDPAATGISGPTPGEGEAVITEDLAETLGAAPGDEVTASLYGESVTLEVARVLPRLGVAGFWTGFESVSPNAFVAPGTIEETAGAQLPPGARPPLTSVLVSNRGGVEEGAALTGEVRTLIEDVLGPGTPLRVETYKQDVLDAAEEQGDMFSELFLGIGSFAVVAGILLLVNIFVMLAEERKSQLGMLRAVGLRRSDLVRSFYIQGALYSVPSGLLGALLGIGVGYAIVVVAAPIFGGFGDFSLDLTFSMEPASIVTGFCTGVLISLVTVFGTSLRISRINIIRAIRDLPDPKQERTRTITLVLGTLGAAGAAAWFVSSLGADDMWPGLLVGPPLFAFALLPLLRRLVPRRTALLAVSLASLAWGIFGNGILGGRIFDGGDIFVFVLQGVLLNVAGVILLSQTQENLEGVLHRFAARSLALRLGLAYPLARRVRTGLTLAMFSLVVFTMVFIAVLARIFGGQVEDTTRREAGGYDILVDSSASNPPSARALAAVEGVEKVAALDFGTALFVTESQTTGADPETEPQPWTVSGVDAEFVAGGPPALEERPPRFATDEDAWRALLEDPGAVIVPEFFLVEGGGPQGSQIEIGEDLTIVNPLNGAREMKEIIALSGNDFAFSGVYASRTREFRELLRGSVTPSRFYVAAEGSESDARRTAVRLQGELVENGVEAVTFRTRVEEFGRVNLQFLRLMQGYLALGLLVGIAGLGVVMVRAVRERRRQVGVLRSLGFLPGMVRRAFLLESGFTAVEGILLGTALALVTASQLVANGDFGQGVEFQVPWLDVSVLCVVSLVASLLATAWPAQQASQIPPAVALRVAD